MREIIAEIIKSVYMTAGDESLEEFCLAAADEIITDTRLGMFKMPHTAGLKEAAAMFNSHLQKLRSAM